MSDKVNNMLVSFIIPAYNAADTIERCLNSVYALPLKLDEFEVIMIDDCSSDNTIKVIEQYFQKVYGVKCKVYENFTLLKQSENHRQGAARNRGIKIAKGEFICFVDSDDAATEGIVSAIRMAKEKDADMVAFHYGNANEEGNMTSEAKRLSFEEGQIFSGMEMQNKYPYWCSAPWPYIYRKDFLQQVNYPFVEEVLYEDSDFVVAHLYYAQRMAYSSELGYVAYYREGSTTRSSNYKNVADYLLLGTRMLRFYERVAKSQESRVKSQEVENEGIEKFAEGILEGACWNVAKSCQRLVKLENIKAVRGYYDRVDLYASRKTLSGDKRIHKYYWNLWTSLCMKHKHIAIAILLILIPMYKIFKKS